MAARYMFCVFRGLCYRVDPHHKIVIKIRLNNAVTFPNEAAWAILNNEHVFLCGGEKACSLCYILIPGSPIWAVAYEPPMLLGRGGHAAIELGEIVYILGG
jgi:hypothetical protein